jgi:glycosyltransferase involved in cell wall biosynthesis
MNIHLENIDLQNTSGPNHFASKLVRYLNLSSISFNPSQRPDIRLCFIESHEQFTDGVPLIQRLDGIYFNKAQNYKLQNMNIKRTYDNSAGVVFQTNFNKKLITKYFGNHKNSVVIHNGADLNYINNTTLLQDKILDKYENIWSCASSWRPHKRLQENINYFLEHSSPKDLLIIAGNIDTNIINNERIIYVGHLNIEQLISLYKRSDNFIHLAWLDHCPNVVVDARASGCRIICSSSGGTKEIAGSNAVVIEEDEWDFQPVELYNPPKLNFSRRIKNNFESDLCMKTVSNRYEKFLRDILDENFYTKSK